MINNDHYAILDVESGGLHPHLNPLVEVAFIVLNNKLEEVDRYECINQNYNDASGKPLVYAPQAMAVHGITMAQINASPTIHESLKGMDKVLSKYSKGRSKVHLVGHNMEFDMKYMRSVYKYCKMDITEYTYENFICTMKMSHMAWGHDDSMENFKLPTCCERIGVNIADSHRGLADVISTVELFKHHMNNLRSVSTATAVVKRVDEFERSHGFKF